MTPSTPDPDSALPRSHGADPDATAVPDRALLAVIDMQRVFAEPDSPWATPPGSGWACSI